jgi:hypothetical protein
VSTLSAVVGRENLDQPAIDLGSESELRPTDHAWIGSVKNGALSSLGDLLQVRGEEGNVFANEGCGDRRGDSCSKKFVQENV